MKARLRTAVVAGVAAGIVALGAAAWLSGKAVAPSGPPVPAERLTIAYSKAYVGSALVVIAAEQGYFRAEGLEVTLQPQATGAAAVRSVLAGNAHLATVAESGFVFFVLAGHPLAIIASISTSETEHGVVGRRDRGIAAPGDLKGKRIGVVPRTASAFALDYVLSGHNVLPEEVETIALKPEDMADAVSRGKVDAVAVWNSFLRASSKALGDAAVVFGPGAGFRMAFSLAGVREQLRERPEAMKKLVRALLRAEEFAARRPRDAMAIMARASEADPDELRASWADHALQVGLDQRLVTALELNARWAIKHGDAGTSRVPNFLEHLYPDALAAVQAARVSIIR